MTFTGRCTECGKGFRVPHDRKAWSCKVCGGAVLLEEAEHDEEEAGILDPAPAEREGASERRGSQRSKRSRGPKRRSQRTELEWEVEEDPAVTTKALRKSLVKTLFANVLMTASLVFGLPTLKALDLGQESYELFVF